jgi:hypothetical protein
MRRMYPKNKKSKYSNPNDVSIKKIVGIRVDRRYILIPWKRTLS